MSTVIPRSSLSSSWQGVYPEGVHGCMHAIVVVLAHAREVDGVFAQVPGLDGGDEIHTPDHEPRLEFEGNLETFICTRPQKMQKKLL